MTFKHKLIAGLAAASTVLFLVAVLSYLSLAHNVEDRQWVTHTHAVIEKLDDVQTSIIDAETGQRGYIIAGEDSYLAPFNGLSTNTPVKFGRIPNLGRARRFLHIGFGNGETVEQIG